MPKHTTVLVNLHLLTQRFYTGEGVGESVVFSLEWPSSGTNSRSYQRREKVANSGMAHVLEPCSARGLHEEALAWWRERKTSGRNPSAVVSGQWSTYKVYTGSIPLGW